MTKTKVEDFLANKREFEANVLATGKLYAEITHQDYYKDWSDPLEFEDCEFTYYYDYDDNDTPVTYIKISCDPPSVDYDTGLYVGFPASYLYETGWVAQLTEEQRLKDERTAARKAKELEELAKWQDSHDISEYARLKLKFEGK